MKMPMIPDKPDLLILPFTARLPGTTHYLGFDQAMYLLRKGKQLEIERSYPGHIHAVGWTIFRRVPGKYLYDNEPFFHFECGARRYIRRAYAIHYALIDSGEITPAHLEL